MNCCTSKVVVFQTCKCYVCIFILLLICILELASDPGYLYPIHHTLFQDSTAKFQCSSMIEMEWFHNDDKIERNNGKYSIVGNSLHIKNVKKADQGEVECQGFDNENSTLLRLYSSHLYVRGKLM